MTYTFWHSGILIGDSDLNETSDNPGQRAGIFQPTPHGLEIFPRLSGIFSVGHPLKTRLDANGIDAEDLNKDDDSPSAEGEEHASVSQRQWSEDN